MTGGADKLATQLYFPGEPLNDKDRLLRHIPRKEALIGRVLQPTPDLEPDSVILAWDAVLARG